MIYYLLIIVFYLIFVYLAWQNIAWGLYLICALLPAYLIRYSIFGLPATLLEGLIIMAFIVWLVKLKKEKNLTFNPLTWIKNILNPQSLILNRQNPVPSSLRLPLILLLIAATVSIFVSPDFRAAAGVWKAYFMEAIMFLLLFVYNIKTTTQIKKVIYSLGLTTLAIGLFALIQKFTGLLIPNPFWAEAATRRVTTFFGYPNANALFVLPVIFLTIANLLTEKKRLYKYLDILVLALAILTIILTKSTGAVLGLIAGLLFWLTFNKKTRLAALIILAVVVLGLNFSPAVKNKIAAKYLEVQSTHLPLNPSDLHMRVQQWRETYQLMAGRQILGAGLAGYQTAVAPFHQNPHVEIYLYPHNFFLNFWTETGLLGLISIVWILIIFFRLIHNLRQRRIRLWRTLFIIRESRIKNNELRIMNKERILTLASTCAMIALLVYGLVDVPYFKNDLAILFWIIVGIVIVIYNNSRRRAGVVERDALEKR